MPGPGDTDFDIDAAPKIRPQPSPLGAGYLVLVVRELSGMSQRALARAIGTSQPTLATLADFVVLREPSPVEGPR